MKITNDLNLPEPIVAAVANDPYNNAGTLSVTTIINPPQQVAITRKHQGEITEDASDRIWSLVGQIGHTIVERAAGLLDPKDWVCERRYYTDTYDERISGQVDLVHVPDRTVYDYKFTSGWAVKDAMSGGKGDWQKQLSLLAMLAREGRYLIPNALGEPGTFIEMEGDPVEITHGKIIAIVRDWTETQAARNPDWPQKPIAVIDMEILSDAETREYLETKLEGLKFALEGGDVPCTDEERWFRPGKWAVYKGTNKTAAKLADSEDELSAWIFANGSKVGSNYRIEERPGEYKRCEKYCAAAPFCAQYQSTRTAEGER